MMTNSDEEVIFDLKDRHHKMQPEIHEGFQTRPSERDFDSQMVIF